ncbi:MAG: acetate/propionate family kinase [Pseudomonadota bacterium]|nr:acetate/propionate family kinase [Pseudomonadota bacterium]
MSARHVLTINAGSATLKFGLYEAGRPGAEPAQGWRITIDRLGTDAAELVATPVGGERIRRTLGARSHAADALGDLLDFLAQAAPGLAVAVVSHRVVHGGPDLRAPLAVEPALLEALRGFEPLAPLHQPHNIAGIEAAHAAFPDAMQVACFDTAFHRGQPKVNDVYALPPSFYDEGVRRYGFHGLSYEYIAARLPAVSPRLAAGRVVVAHLGSGASMCAIDAGRPVSSSMGFSALDGLPMGTRCGQIDPGVLLWLMQARGLDADAISRLLYHRSGLAGMSGVGADMRTLEASGEPAAAFAIEHFTTRIRRETGALAASAGGIDGMVFTAGIGENSARVRADVLRGLRWLGFELDEAANAGGGRNGDGGIRRITTDGSALEAWVIPTDEESMLARHGLAVLEAAGDGNGRRVE